MTLLEALQGLLARLGATRGAAALLSEEELSQWPAEAVRALKSQRLLSKASPATSVICPGCEQQCAMPVHAVVAEMGNAASFVVCDKRDDIDRVPVCAEQLRQWSASLSAMATLIAELLGCIHADAETNSSERREVGLLKGRKHSSHVVLVANGGLNLLLAGHCVAVADVLTLDGGSLRIDRQTLLRLLDKPIAGAGDIESAAQRRARLAKLVREGSQGQPGIFKDCGRQRRYFRVPTEADSGEACGKSHKRSQPRTIRWIVHLPAATSAGIPPEEKRP